MDESIYPAGEPIMAYHLLRYTPDLVRDESVNIGVLVFDPKTGASRLRIVEEPSEFARIRRLLPTAEEDVIRNLRDHLEDRVAVQLANQRLEEGAQAEPGTVLQELIVKWNSTLSNSIQLIQQKGVHSDDLDSEADRLYLELVALPRPEARHKPLRGRAMIREYCAQVFRQAQLWSRMQRAVRVSEFTFPGDPMRIDFGYRKNGARGFVHTLSVSQAPADCKLLAYTAERIAKRAAFPSEFTAVTDVRLEPEDNERHRFVRDTLREAGIETLDMNAFATWAPKLKAQLH